MLKEVFNIVQYSLVLRDEQKFCMCSTLFNVYMLTKLTLRYILILFARCRVRVQATDGKGTNFESINLTQSSNTSDFFQRERERAKV